MTDADDTALQTTFYYRRFTTNHEWNAHCRPQEQ